MTVRQHGQIIYHWNGMSSDVKPMSGVPEGSTFHVVDTGEVYMFHNDMWVLDLRQIYIQKYTM